MSDMRPDNIFDQIWTDDLFDRRTEAQQLSAYLESLTSAPMLRGDKKAFTIAVDASYGEGKSFFLKRFARHLAINQPVAFVDSWADDLADEPLTALAATLKEALRPYLTDPLIEKRVSSFIRKSGKVAKIASIGLFRRGVSLAITGGALSEIDGVITGLSDEIKDAVVEEAGKIGEGVVSTAEDALINLDPQNLMNKRIEEFEKGRAAISEMKRSLVEIIEAIRFNKNGNAQIVIVIDELDRCRPNYAIKLLEEIKHLFDVSGLVFILGIHCNQLAHAVSGAYGPAFDGRAYLRRFIDREYRLATPSLIPLLEQLCKSAGLNAKSINLPNALRTSRDRVGLSTETAIAEYMITYGLAARDAFQIVDILQMSTALAGDQRLQGAYLIPLVIGKVMGLPRGDLPVVEKQTDLRLYRIRTHPTRELIQMTLDEAAREFESACTLSGKELNDAYNSEDVSWGVQAICTTRAWNADPLPIWDVSRYPELIETVGRFQSTAFIDNKNANAAS